VWLYKDAEKKQAVIAFRGTEQVKWKDLLTDLNLTPTSLNPERIDDDVGLPLLMRLAKSAMETEEKMKVHGGFLAAYDSVRMQVVRMLDQITGTGDKGEWRVLVTGHSLGGALATLCAYELSERQGPAGKVQDVCMYSYGAPRVGNKRFAALFNERVPDSWRITNRSDIIPSMPRLLGYSHVKHSVRLDTDGKLVIQDQAGDVFGEGRAGADVVKELLDSVQNETKTFEEVYDTVAAHEMEIFNSLVGGAALEQHMEEFYLETLRACVLANARASPPPNE
jgi:predicted lipase